MNQIKEPLLAIGQIEWACWGLYETDRGQELAYPPIVRFRYKEPSSEKAELLQRLIDSFRGTIPWELRVAPKPRAWLLMPARLAEYTKARRLAGEFEAAAKLMVTDPDFGKQANKELRLLAEHMRQQLGTAVAD